MAQSIKKWTKSNEAQQIIVTELERLRDTPGMNTSQLSQRDTYSRIRYHIYPTAADDIISFRICSSLEGCSPNSARGIMGYSTNWLSSVNELLAKGYKLREDVLKQVRLIHCATSPALNNVIPSPAGSQVDPAVHPSIRWGSYSRREITGYPPT